MEYKVTLNTGNLFFATSFNKLFITLIGDRAKSKRTELSTVKRALAAIFKGGSSVFAVTCDTALGKLVMIEIETQSRGILWSDSWYPAMTHVETPDGDTYSFPMYNWVTRNNTYSFREGTALTLCADTGSNSNSRRNELKKRQVTYSWASHEDGLPYCLKTEDSAPLPYDDRFSYTKEVELKLTALAGLAELKLKWLDGCEDDWKLLSDIQNVFYFRHTPVSDYVQEHWKEDTFFGNQFLNGVNPMLIRRCDELPQNFPVTEEMFSSVPGRCDHCTLAGEMKEGNIFLCDYKLLDGVTTNVIANKQQYLTAPLVLLLKTTEDEPKMIPVAIQLKQEPAEDNPIFLPSDSKYDWLLAKVFVRSADFNEHQLNAHLLRTHLLAEVFSVAVLRNLPAVHPLFKLLIPHVRYTFKINLKARRLLISDTGFFMNHTASGTEGVITILRRAMDSLTYRSLCIPDDIADRRLESVPNFYYRDDGLKLWGIIHRFVDRMLSHYYEDDRKVKEDSELQSWIQDIYCHGFLSKQSSGIPQKLNTRDELVKFVTMVIFTCSAQHAAVNSGQFDYGGWMPNTPTSLKFPPPTQKGEATLSTLLQTLPNVNTTAHGMNTLWVLSKPSSDFVPLGHYPEKHFTEEFPLKLIEDFQKELKLLSEYIQERNKMLAVPYTYLDPAKVENSVTV